MKTYKSFPLLLGLLLLTSCFGCSFQADMKEFLTSPPPVCSTSYDNKYNGIDYVLVYEYSSITSDFKDELPCLLNYSVRTLKKTAAVVAFHIKDINTFAVYHFHFNLDRLTLETFTKPSYMPIPLSSYTVEKYDYVGALEILQDLNSNIRPSNNLISATTSTGSDTKVEAYINFLKTGKVTKPSK